LKLAPIFLKSRSLISCCELGETFRVCTTTAQKLGTNTTIAVITNQGLKGMP